MLRGLFLFKPMAYDKHLAGRITDCLSHISLLEEKKMFGGIGFMVNEKLSVGVMNDEMIVRCGPEISDDLLTQQGVRPFDFTGKPMKNWVVVHPSILKTDAQLQEWINIALDYNKKAKKSKKKK